MEDIVPRVVEIANIIPAAANPVAPVFMHLTNEHYLPLLYALALRTNEDPVAFFANQVVLGSISMQSVRIG